MKSTILGLLAAGLLAGPFAANAIPIPVGSGSGTGLILNYDFTGQASPPPYAYMSFRFLFSGGGTVFYEAFNDLNATGGLAFSGQFAFSSGDVILGGTNSVPGVLDGLLSAVFRSSNGAVELTENSVTALAADGTNLVRISGTPGSAVAVPEPGTLLLLSGGLLALGAARRRRPIEG